MPAEDRVDPTRLNASMLNATLLDAVAARLARASADALEASHELLTHYPDTGDASTQRAVDTLIDQAAHALGTLTDSLTETSRGLVAAALATSPQSGDSSPARAGRRQGPIA